MYRTPHKTDLLPTVPNRPSRRFAVFEALRLASSGGTTVGGAPPAPAPQWAGSVGSTGLAIGSEAFEKEALGPSSMPLGARREAGAALGEGRERAAR